MLVLCWDNAAMLWWEETRSLPSILSESGPVQSNQVKKKESLLSSESKEHQSDESKKFKPFILIRLVLTLYLICGSLAMERETSIHSPQNLLTNYSLGVF